MKDFEHIYFKTRDSFRSWLEKNHDTCSGIWMIFYRKGKNTECITYQEALEEALCFGWIDSIIKKVDDEHYVRKFTPRTDISKWSDVNKKLVLLLIKNNQMTEAGLRKIDIYLKTGKVEWQNESTDIRKKEFHVPDFIIREFAKNEPALTHFNHLAPSHQRQFVLWVTNARREETIMKRLKECIEILKENKKLGLK